MSESKHIRSVLLIPFGAVNPQQGGGQRTAILYEALAELGPVLVVQLVETLSPDRGPKVFFPRADDFRQIKVKGYGPPPASLVTRAARKLRQFLLPQSDYTVRTGARAEFDEICAEFQPDIVVSRYVRPYRSLGLDASGSAIVAVDVDDRDDQRMMSYFDSICKIGALQKAYAGYIKATFSKTLATWLAAANHVWFAKAPDQISLPATSTSIWHNVPFFDGMEKGPALDQREPILIFVANIGHLPNRTGITWFLEKCWPRIRARVPEAGLHLVGRGPWQSIEDRFGTEPGVVFVGGVDDLGDQYRQAKAAISPIFVGAGSQIKLIEACAYGLPVVSTSMCASGFGENITSQLLLADDPDGFVEACVTLLTNDEVASHRGDTLQKLQKAGFSKAAVISALQDDIRQLLT